MDSQLVQLKPCQIFGLLFISQDLDNDCEFLLHGALFGFNVINKDCPSSYHSNFRKVWDDLQCSFIPSKLHSELQKDHIACTEATAICSHNIFTVPKSSGEGYRCVVDCSKPQELSVNNYVNQVCQTCYYKGVDDLVDEIVIDDNFINQILLFTTLLL